MENTAFTQGHVRAIASNVEETRTVEFVISTNARDRYRTVLNPQNWKLDSFNANGIIGYNHNLYGDMCNAPSPDDVIGAGRAWLEGEQLIGSVTFEPGDENPLAEKIFRKVLRGTLKATSVGFTPFGKGRWGEGDEARGMDNETYYYEGQELLEFSIVNIPANPEALKRSVRDQTSHALMYLRRATGFSFADIENMTVRDVLGKLEDADATSSKGRSATSPAGEGATIPVPDASAATETVKVTETQSTPALVRACLRDALSSTRENNIREALRAALS